MIHSRWTTILSGAIAAAGALLVAACGSSSTSPKGQSAAQVAAYYDALVGTHLAAGTATDTLDAEIISILNGPIAYGQLPARIAVSASGASQSWYGNAIVLIDSAATDSAVAVFLWSDTAVSSFILAEAESDSLPHLGLVQFIANSGAFANRDTTTVSVTPGVKSGSCATNIAITYPSAILPTYDPANLTCTPATVTIAGHLHFEAEAGIASQFQDIDLASTALSAVRLQAMHGAVFSRVRGLPHGIMRAR